MIVPKNSPPIRMRTLAFEFFAISALIGLNLLVTTDLEMFDTSYYRGWPLSYCDWGDHVFGKYSKLLPLGIAVDVVVALAIVRLVFVLSEHSRRIEPAMADATWPHVSASRGRRPLAMLIWGAILGMICGVLTAAVLVTLLCVAFAVTYWGGIERLRTQPKDWRPVMELAVACMTNVLHFASRYGALFGAIAAIVADSNSSGVRELTMTRRAVAFAGAVGFIPGYLAGALIATVGRDIVGSSPVAWGVGGAVLGALLATFGGWCYGRLLRLLGQAMANVDLSFMSTHRTNNDAS